MTVFEYRITRAEVLMGRDSEYPLTVQMEENLSELLRALNRFRAVYGKPMTVTSGYRPGRFNVKAGGAPNSTHLDCRACDFADPDGQLDDFCTKNVQVLEQCGLYLEHPDSTPGWTHLDTKPRNNRIFRP